MPKKSNISKSIEAHGKIEVYINQGGYISISQDNDCYSSTVIALDECCIDKLIKMLLDVKEEYKIQFGDNNE